MTATLPLRYDEVSMMTRMDEYFLEIEARNGFIARGEVLAAGLDDRFIRCQLRTRRWTRIRKGAYLFTSSWQELDPEERHRRLARAVLHSHGDRVVLSKVSGLLMHPGIDCWDVDLSRVHVTRRDSRAGSVERDVVHHEGPIADDDIVEIDGLLVSTESRCAVETIALAPLEAGLVVADSVLHRGRVDHDRLWEELARMQRWRGSRRADVVLRLADGRSESVGESRSRYLFWSQGLPKPDLQVKIRDAGGSLVGVVDLGWLAHGTLYEFDGRVKYGRLVKPGQQPSDVLFAEKRREDAIREATGCSIVRATWADLSQPRELAMRVRARMKDSA
jgi:hypothetical protein